MKKTKIQDVVAQYEERIKANGSLMQASILKLRVNQNPFGMRLRGELPIYGFWAT